MDSLFSNIPLLKSLWQREDLTLGLMKPELRLDFKQYRENILRDMTRDVWSSVIEDFSTLNKDNEFFNVKDGAVVSGLPNSDGSDPIEVLKKLIPWRKGPWQFGDTFIDAEWRSNIKYSELSPLLPLLKDQVVMDIGGGNGYYGFRLRFDGVAKVINLDPSEKFFYQFELAQKFIQDSNIQYEPLGYQDVHRLDLEVDAAMSMGVLYHQKNPLSVLESLKSCLKPGGFAIIESMSIPGDSDFCLFPEGRYAKARNVYFLPTQKTLVNMCKRAGFTNIEIISDRITGLEEQRSTEWMPYESLIDFLDPNDTSLTLEGYPAPRRTVIVARKKPNRKRYEPAP